MELRKALKSGALAGIIAGLLLGVLLFAFQEPLIQRAICYEQGQSPPCTPAEEMVPRVWQQVAVVPTITVVGLVIGLLFALVYGTSFPYLPGKTVRQRALVLSALGFLVFPLLPSLRVPPQPPGIENAVSADVRGVWYALIMLGGVTGVTLGFVLYHLLVRRDPSSRGHIKAGVLSLLIMVGVVATPLVLIPGSPYTGNILTEEPSLLPLYVAVFLSSFAAFWVSLGLAYSVLRTRSEQAQARGSEPEAA